MKLEKCVVINCSLVPRPSLSTALFVAMEKSCEGRPGYEATCISLIFELDRETYLIALQFSFPTCIFEYVYLHAPI